jgi:hypothetical protein
VHDKILCLSRQRQDIITSGVLIGPEFPEGILTTTGMDAAKSQDVLGARNAPKHARLLAA